MPHERRVYLAAILLMALGSLAMATALAAPTLRGLLAGLREPEPCPCATDPFDDSRFDDGLTREQRVRFVKKQIRSTVTIYVDNYSPKKGLRDSSATGVVIDADGTVLTAYHVVDEAEFVQVGFLELDADEEIVETRYVPMRVDAYLKDIDSAILKPVHPEKDLPPPMPLALDWEPKLKEVLWHFGSTTEWSQGKVRNTGFDHLIQPIKEKCVTVGAKADYGDSGGPVVTLKGELVGILLTISPSTKTQAHFMPVSTVIDRLAMSCH